MTSKIAYIHPKADVLSTHIGAGTNIWQFCVVLPNAVIGQDCNISCNCFVENDVVIGDQVTIKSGVQIWDGVRLGNRVFVGPNVTFTNDLLPRSKKAFTCHETIVEDGVTIGANATIIAGITLGKFAMIGAGSVVTKSIPPYTLWYGNPAQHRGYVTEDAEVIGLNLEDKEGNQYQLIDGIPTRIP